MKNPIAALQERKLERAAEAALVKREAEHQQLLNGMDPIDYRANKTRWGHALHTHGKVENGVIHASIHCATPPVGVGRRITWSVPPGTVIAEIFEHRPCYDPPDMHSIRAKIVERIDITGKTVWTEKGGWVDG